MYDKFISFTQDSSAPYNLEIGEQYTGSDKFFLFPSFSSQMSNRTMNISLLKSIR